MWLKGGSSLKIDIDALAEEHGLELNAVIDLDGMRKHFLTTDKCPCCPTRKCGVDCVSFWEVVKEGANVCTCQLFRRPADV